MNLAMLEMDASDTAVVPLAATPITTLSHHVRHTFLALLGKLDVDGNTKLLIICGPRGDHPLPLDVLGVTIYYIDDFDFAKFYAFVGAERDDFLLDVIEQVLVERAEAKGRPPETIEAIRKTVRAVRERDCQLEIPIKKLSKATPDRKLKVEVYRHLNRSDGEVWSVRVVRKGQPAVHADWMTERPDYLNRTEFFAKAEWAGDDYLVRNRFDKVVYQISRTRLEAAANGS